MSLPMPGSPAGPGGAGPDPVWGRLSPSERVTLAWARSLIRAGSRGDPPPRFGSREWLALPDRDRRKVAAVVMAAVCWWDESRPSRLVERTEQELEARRVVDQRLDEEEFTRLAARVRGVANSPTHEELQRRRAEPRDPVVIDGREVMVSRTRPDFPGRCGAAVGESVEEGKPRQPGPHPNTGSPDPLSVPARPPVGAWVPSRQPGRSPAADRRVQGR